MAVLTASESIEPALLAALDIITAASRTPSVLVVPGVTTDAADWH